MAEALSSIKGTVRKGRQDVIGSRSSLQYGSTPLGNVNNGRLSLMSSARLQRITSNSLEKLSFISEKEDSDDFENYHLEYSTYLLRKVQSRVLAQHKEQKEENVKECFVSLKFEFEGLLDKYLQLSKEIGYLKVFFEILRETNRKIEEGRKILKVLKEIEFDSFMKSVSLSLDQTINQLHLVDMDKSALEEAFSKKIWGCGSEMEQCLRKIDDFISKDKEEVSNIATELVEIKRLCLENATLRERFCSEFEKISDDHLETNYGLFTSIVKKALSRRRDCVEELTPQGLDCDLTELLQSAIKPGNKELTFQLSKLDCSYAGMPNSASTPQNLP